MCKMDIFDFLFGLICGANALEEALHPKKYINYDSSDTSSELTEEDIDAIFNDSENDDIL